MKAIDYTKSEARAIYKSIMRNHPFVVGDGMFDLRHLYQVDPYTCAILRHVLEIGRK